jgi:hypothetical protein
VRRIRALVAVMAIVGTVLAGGPEDDLGGKPWLGSIPPSPDGHRWTGVVPGGPGRFVGTTRVPDGHRWESVA